MGFDLIRGLVLGAVQGLTEFFPVSSSGHLILVPILLHWTDQGLAFDTVLHLGTLTALMWFFRGELVGLILRPDWAFIGKLAAATVPALIVGFLVSDLAEAYFRQSWIVVANLVAFGVLLFIADRTGKGHMDDFQRVSWKQALLVGCCQPLALIPGVSRSGITITAGLFSGLTRQAAARFSFFLSIPITAAAGLNGLLKVVQHGNGSDGIMMLAVGFVSALSFGLFAIRFLLSYVAKRPFDWFVAYRLALALVVLLLV